MTKSTMHAGQANSAYRQNAAMPRHKKNAQHTVQARPLIPENDAVKMQFMPKNKAIAEAKSRWPGIAVLTTRHLSNELGIAVYFTFPDSKHMAVWISGIDELGIAVEDRPCWHKFLSKRIRASDCRLLPVYREPA